MCSTGKVITSKLGQTLKLESALHRSLDEKCSIFKMDMQLPFFINKTNLAVIFLS